MGATLYRHVAQSGVDALLKRQRRKYNTACPGVPATPAAPKTVTVPSTLRSRRSVGEMGESEV